MIRLDERMADFGQRFDQSSSELIDRLENLLETNTQAMIRLDERMADFGQRFDQSSSELIDRLEDLQEEVNLLTQAITQSVGEL